MGMNFPASPLVGDIYPTPAVPGLPQYIWDGTIWRAQTPPSTFVKLAGDTMTGDLTLPRNAASALHAVPKQQLDARVMDAMAYSGMQINGGMEVSQEYGTSTPNWVGSIGGKYILDGWMAETVGGPTFATAQSAAAPSGFIKSFNMWTNGAFNPVGGERANIRQTVEGYRWSKLGWGTAAGQPVTIGFWIAPDRSATISLVVKNNPVTRTYCVSIPVTATGWQYKTVTIPPCVDGTWATDNTAGAHIIITLACGPTETAPTANTWLSGGTYNAAPGQTSLFQAAVGFNLTGVVVLPGIYAPTAAQSPLIMRPYDQELLTCKRYWQKSYDYGTALGANTGVGIIQAAWAAPASSTIAMTTATLPVEMRSQPTLSVWDLIGTGAKISTINNGGTPSHGQAPDSTAVSTKTVFMRIYNLPTAVGMYFHYAVDARL